MPKVAKIPSKIFLVVTEWSWANGNTHKTVAMYSTEGQARGERTRQLRAAGNRRTAANQYVDWSCLIYQADLTWELHPDTADIGMDMLLSELEKQ